MNIDNQIAQIELEILNYKMIINSNYNMNINVEYIYSMNMQRKSLKEKRYILMRNLDRKKKLEKIGKQSW